MKYWYRFYYGLLELMGKESCEECNKWVSKKDMQVLHVYGSRHYFCDSCYEHNFCECGQRLEDAYGLPGDGFCVSCQ